eukprot:XP_019920631.1 PREDICTED: uncharacterized protein LOC109617970 [Crassostrea gigas]
MSDNCRVSEALYAGLCRYIGTPTDVTVRREVMDMAEMIRTPVEIDYGVRKMKSGSYRECFRFKSSDLDTMFWITNHKVITDPSQSSVYDLSKHSIILMEDIETSPGFVRLQLLTSPRDTSIESSVVPYNDGMYISCMRWRQRMLSMVSGNKRFNNTKTHGPCANAFIDEMETDYALCFHCSHWSRLTYYWRKRCNLHNWPPNHVFSDILGNGCHLVPVGNKKAADENELDWRLSFSQAEQKLVYSMSHTQFLCYGLLKIFLKEVINLDIEEPFLCSYFVKTTMFWLIQIGHITWCPDNLLDCFWKCFKYLLQSVHRGVFPNFFVPQNNMFDNKLSTVKGAHARRCLLEQLNMYYEMGVTCLLHSPTVKTMIEPVICNSFVRIEPLLNHIKSAADTDYCIRREIYDKFFSQQNIRNNYLMLRLITVLMNQSFTEYETLTLQQCTADVLKGTAFINLSTSSSSDCTNKKVYRSDRLTCNLLKLAGRFGHLSCLLYLAMYFYRTCRYGEALHVTALIKSRLTHPYIMYNTVDRERYNECVAGWSLSKRMKKAWVNSVLLDKDGYYIPELILEQRALKDNAIVSLRISPYVMTDMLSVLCNYKLGNRSQCLQSMTDLQTLLLYDDGRYVPLILRDLSWQILGICQHVVGDLHGALHVTAFIILSTSSSSDSTNTKIYRSDRLTCNLLKLASRVGHVSCMLACRYKEALRVTALVKSRLTQPYIMYNTLDRKRYNECVAVWSLSKRMTNAWVNEVCLHVDIYYIQELVLEQRVGKDNGQYELFISPYIMTDILNVLSNYRLGNRSQCQQSLTDLQTLLLYDDGGYVALHIRDLSWLGICQHVVGDLHGALQSYQQSLRQKPWHKIQNATKYRIALVLNQLN